MNAAGLLFKQLREAWAAPEGYTLPCELATMEAFARRSMESENYSELKSNARPSNFDFSGSKL
eukprot:3524986-Alexandrium_andersonii.AAC.1